MSSYRRLNDESNRYRELDGGDHAAENLVLEVRKNSNWKNIPIMIYCGQPDKAQKLTKFPHVSITREAKDILPFLQN